MNFPAVFNISALSSGGGAVIGAIAPGERFGASVAGAGDVNGDGWLDLIVGATHADLIGSNSGAAYVLFGSASGFSANMILTPLDGTNGFRIVGAGAGAFAGYSVASAGDFNGDGYGDLIVGAVGDANGAGGAYVVFGKASGFTADLQIADLDGTNGFRFGPGDFDLLGQTVRSGDINGDGLSDLIISEPLSDTYAPDSGGVYVIFGTTAPMAATLSPADLDGVNGFRVFGPSEPYEVGSAIGVADFNDDGYDDILATAPLESVGDRGTTFIYYGRAGGFADTDTFNVTTTTQIHGVSDLDFLGRSVASAGDVNGDGIEDIIIGSVRRPANMQYGGAYVVFGRSTVGPSIGLNFLNGSNGFLIPGLQSSSETGTSVASAGDIDADGYDDLIIGAPAVSGFGFGEAFILYGKAAFGSGVIDTAALNGEDGFRIQGNTFLGAFGSSVSGAGDLNGDGFDDMIVGAPNALGPNQQTGVAYVIYGRARDRFLSGDGGDNTLTGHLGDDQLSGLAGDDQLSGMAGKDRLDGGGANDLLDGGDGNDLLIGGDGADDLVGGLGGDSLFGDAGADELSGGDGADKLYGGTGADLLTGVAGNDRMAGEADVDSLNGGDGNDYLDGGAAADILTGGLGNDVFLVDDALDQTIEAAGEGYDIVRADRTWTLAANIEALELAGSADADGTGNADANNLQGNSGANALSGLGGVDTINGNDGDDIIVGGLGNDLLRGGLGADRFVVAHAFGPVLETDQVYDFSAAEGDVIDLSGAYAGTISLVSSFTKHAGEMTLTFAAGITTLRLDTTGDGKVDYQMKINGDVTGESGDWLL